MELSSGKMICFGKEFDFNSTYVEVKELMQGHIYDCNDRLELIDLQPEFSFGCDCFTTLTFENTLKRVHLSPLYEEYGENPDLRYRENDLSAKYRNKCIEYLNEKYGPTPLTNDEPLKLSDNHVIYFVDDFFVDLYYFGRDESFNIDIYNYTFLNINRTFHKYKDYYIDRIAKETNNTIELSTKIFRNIDNLNEMLTLPLIEWAKGNEMDYSYKGITIKEIAEKRQESYFQAMFEMSTLMKNDDYVEFFKNSSFKRK